MSLTEYRQKRNFHRTDEPRGKPKKSCRTLSFTVQKHAASHLHYDLRLELGGVLKSWAVPKGPSLNPKQKRLAVHVEDHPLEYGGFEGTIPQGEYGGGTVLLWDRGTWEPVADPELGYREGHLKFTLRGEKLKGRWVLLKTNSKTKPSQRNWLLIKEQDEFAESSHEITSTTPKSVASHRELDEIAEGKTASRTTRVLMAAQEQPASKKPTSRSRSLVNQNTHPGLVAGVPLTHPEKVYYPDDGITKLDLAHYYERVAEWMIPHVRNRLLSLVRCPGGTGKCFFQKHPSDGVFEHRHRYIATMSKAARIGKYLHRLSTQ